MRDFLIYKDTSLGRSRLELGLAQVELGKAREKIAIELSDKEKSIKDAEHRLADGRKAETSSNNTMRPVPLVF